MSESSSKTTTELEVIKKWAEERDGKPSRVKSTADDEGGGVLRIDFLATQVKTAWKRFHGRNGMKHSRTVISSSYTRIIQQEVKKAVFLN